MSPLLSLGLPRKTAMGNKETEYILHTQTPATEKKKLNWEEASYIRAFGIYANFELSVETQHRCCDALKKFQTVSNRKS